MSWGTSWGTSWGGGGSDPAFAVVSARAVASNTVRVTFTKRPLFESPLNLGDSSKLTYWSLARTDKAQTLTILAARGVSGDETSLDFVIIQRWVSDKAIYEITGSPELRAADKIEKIDANARSATFFGSPPIIPFEDRAKPPLDLWNAQTDPTQFEGGLTVGADGDYLHETGISFLKKIIYRDVIWAQAEARHLASVPFGLGYKPKSFIRSTDIATRQHQLKLRISQYPEVQSCFVAIDLKEDGQLVVVVKARTKFGPLELSYSNGAV